MRPGFKRLFAAALIAPALLITTFGRQMSFGDEPSILGRIFRFSSNSTASGPPQPRPSAAPTPSEDATPPSLLFSSPAPASSPVSTATPRIMPQPRVNRAVTEADPILTRVALVRSSDGAQFGMFQQIFADGTVLDNEGVHRVSQADLRPIVAALQTGDLYRARGHCGAPATDFVEQVHIVVFERSLGRLKATAFSYSGNPQGCDHAVRHLHTALEALQAKLARSAAPVAATPAVTTFTAAPRPVNAEGPSIPLSPPDQ